MDFLGDELDEVLNIFQQESLEILQSMSECLVALEKEPKNEDIALKLFRSAHSLKGSVRMLGFNNIQNVAHKIEDVIWLIKEHKIIPDKAIIETINRAVDYIGFLVNKTVEKKDEYFTDDINNYIKELEEIGKSQEFRQKEPKREEILKILTRIEAFIIEVDFFYLKYKKDNDFDCVLELKNRVFDLKNAFEQIELQKGALKLQEILNAVSLMKPEQEGVGLGALQNLEMKISDFTKYFIEFCKENQIETKDYAKFAQNQLSQFETFQSETQENKACEIKKINKDVNENLVGSIKELGKDVILLENNFDIMPKIDEKINRIIEEFEFAELKRAYKIILKILKNYVRKGVFTENTINLLSQIILDSAEVIEDADSKEFDFEIIEKRVILLEETCNFDSNIIAQRKEDKKPEAQKPFRGKDWLEHFDSSEIKTLRVDSSKLDMLASQVSDLILTRIKNTEHLILIKKLQNEFEEWQKSWHKVGYYIKYYDRKYLTGSDISLDIQSVVSYNKQLMSLYVLHSEECNKMFEFVHFLCKQMQDGDSKLTSLTTDLENMTKNLRILPLATIFHLFPRMVHNIAGEKGKEIDFRIEGSEVSADKKIIEEIKIPLMHILRNSIDHGIELPEERKKAGKAPVGKILITARNLGNKILIDIKDDGKGVDIDKVRSIAVEKGLISHQESMNITSEQILDFIFYPGFSTEEKVTDLSGRGLGLDIVRGKIMQLNGKINIYSHVGEGTCLRVELPVAMATINAFIVSEQNQFFAVDTSSISTVTRIMPEDIFIQDNKNYFVHRDKVIPIFTLSQILGFKNTIRYADKNTVMVLKENDDYVGVIVDKLVGDQEILQKKLTAPLLKVKNVSGITTLANGETCLILNVQDILNTNLSGKTSVNIITSNKIIEMQKNSKYKILVVDDSVTTRTLQKNILKNCGYQVQMATDGDEALEILKEGQYDLVVTDYDMPKMTGLEFLKLLRANPENLKTPVIVLSSYDAELLKDKFEVYHIEKYIQKSDFNQEEFTKCINYVLENKAGVSS